MNVKACLFSVLVIVSQLALAQENTPTADETPNREPAGQRKVVPQSTIGGSPQKQRQQPQAMPVPAAPAGQQPQTYVPLALEPSSQVNDYRRSHFSLQTHGGLLLSSGDPAIRSKWDHDILYSYMMALGGYYNLNLGNGFWIFGGGDFTYWKNEENLKGSGQNSFLISTYYQVMGTLGVVIEPPSLRGFGVSIAGSYQAWGQKNTDIQSSGFTNTFGPDNTRVLWLVRASAFYDIDYHWKPFLGYEYRTQASVVVLGVSYAL